MSSKLWKNDSFINQNIPYLFNQEIIEYDMKEAGFSLTKEFQLLDKKIIEKLEKYKKDKRKVELGKIQRDDKDYRDNLKQAFAYARKLFIESNDLEDHDIISIKKDALFIHKKCKNQQFGNHIIFRPKNIYTSYIQLPKKMEFYYNYEKLDVKGMNDENIALHEDYMIKFIKSFFLKMETESEEDVIKFTRRFIDKYKRKELEVGYYRTFDYRSIIEVTTEDDVLYKDYWEDKKEDIDISYNYMNILLKLIQIPT